MDSRLRQFLISRNELILNYKKLFVESICSAAALKNFKPTLLCVGQQFFALHHAGHSRGGFVRRFFFGNFRHYRARCQHYAGRG